MSAAWSDQFSRALCQTVPSPFGLGSSDPGGVMLPPLAVVPMRRRRGRFALAPDHAQLTAATSVKFSLVLLHRRVKRVMRGVPPGTAGGDPLWQSAGVATGLDLDTRK